MKAKNLKLNKLIKAGIMLLASLPYFAFAQTPPQGNLVVQFENTPLFSQANFMPGDSISRFVRVINSTDTVQNIVAEAINEFDPDNFGDAFTLQIKEGTNVLFNATLSDFFDGDEIPLSALPGVGEDTVYDFIATFIGSSGNEFSGKNLSFDLLIGFAGEGGTSVTDSTDGGNPINSAVVNTGGSGGAGGGNGGVEIEGLTIYNEEAISVSPDLTSVTIEWDTNHQSTSRVVYGTIPGAFDYTSPPNYGYQFSTPETDTPAQTNGVTHHEVEVNGLIPNVSYYYRVVSSASPPTVGYERNFTINPSGNSTVINNIALVSNGNTSSSVNDIEVGGIAQSNAFGANAIALDETKSTVISETNKRGDHNLAALSIFEINWWWLVVLFIIIMAIVLWQMRARPNQ